MSATLIAPKESQLTARLFKGVSKALRRQQISLPDYLKATWPLIEPSKEFVSTWAVDCIFEHLEAVFLGQIKRLVINIPPRNLKSTLVTIEWPTWYWTERPWTKFIFASYSSTLSKDHSMSRRTLIESPYYQKHWGDMTRIKDDQNRQEMYQNTQRGHMIATSVGGSITGQGGDILVLDDLINPEQAESEAERKRAINFYQKTLLTRLNDKKTGVIVAVEQRTHHQDLSGTVLKEGGWVHVKIPAEAPAREVVLFPLSGREVTREPGDVICPEREDKATLERQKKGMGTRAYSAQYQQEPHAADSGYFHLAWWQYYKVMPISEVLYHWSWDTAMEEGEENDYSCGILFGHRAQGTFIEHIVRGRWQYPELKKIMIAEFNAHPANALLIEDKVSGKSLAQDLARNTNLPVIPVKVAGDKVFRASLCSPYVEAKRVFLPDGAPWIADFLEETSMFPQWAHDDQVDALSQGLNFFNLGSPKPLAAMSGQNAPLDIPRPDWL